MTCVHVKKGTCSPTPAGTDPDYHCSAAKCINSEKLKSAQTCDGKGACTNATVVPCFPYICDFLSSACFTSCTTANENVRCQAYYRCNSTTSQCYSSCSTEKECTATGKCKNMKCVKK